MKKPPDNSKAEVTAAIVKGAVSAIPIVGGIITEVGDLYLNPLEKRKQRWMVEVADALEEIQTKFSRLPKSLEEDDGFISFLYSATNLAIKNHQQEKLDALRNALVSSTDPDRVFEDIVFQFLNYIDELSVTHLHILNALNKNSVHVKEFDSLEQVYEHLRLFISNSVERVIFRSFLHDLDSRFLVRIGDLDDFPEFASKVSPITDHTSAKLRLEVTSFGRRFLSFIGKD